jgi:hypothetical protein
MFVDTFVKHEGLAKTLNEFVDAQTIYTKEAVDVSVKTGTELYSIVADKKFANDLAVSAKEYVNFWTPNKKGK